MNSPKCGPHSVADQLACIASYFSSVSQECRQRSHGRLPLAWVATSPSARLVAEQRHAWVVLPFDSTALAGSPYAQNDNEDNAFGAALANATTPLFTLRAALGLDAADTSSSAATVATTDSASGRVGSSSPAPPTSPSAKVMSWISQTTESLSDVNHAASPVESQKPVFLGTSRAKPPAQRSTRSTRPSTGVHGPRVEDPLEAACTCGVHVGGLTTVLVSGAHLYEKRLSCKQPAGPSQCTSHKSPSACGAQTGRDRNINASSTLLFPSTTCCGGSVSSLLCVPPNAAVYDAAAMNEVSATGSPLFKVGAVLHEDDGGAEDETAHDPPTGASVYTVQQVRKLHEQVRGGHVDNAYTTVWYRQLFVNGEEVTERVLCGVSQWWLQRPVRLQELPTTVFATNQPTFLDAPPVYVKFMSDIGANLWWPRRLFSVVHCRFLAHRWHSVALLRWAVLLWVFCAVLVESLFHGVPDVPAHYAASPQDTVDLVMSFQRLGEVYGGKDQLAALDVSHTGVRGVHLLACAIGKVVGSLACHADNEVDRFRALDVAGCIQLHHHQGEMHLLTPQLQSFFLYASQQAQRISSKNPTSPLTLVDLLMAVSLSEETTRAPRSATGLALALLSHHGSLTWVSGPGCSLDNAALHELGTYALLVEAVTSRQSTNVSAAAPALPCWSCSICAMDLTSALSLDDLNAVAYLPCLEQLLVPFTYVTDDGVARMDGHTYPQDLLDFFALCTENKMSMLDARAQGVVKDGMKALEQLTASSNDAPALTASTGRNGHSATTASNSCSNNNNNNKVHHHAVEALHQHFRSHLYQIDFTYCSFLSSVNGLVRQQRLELLNLSQTRINKTGLFGTAEKSRASSPSSSSSSLKHSFPPLRLFIAEMCEHLSDLSGLAHIGTLECVIVRSGSLGDDGLRAICTKDMQQLHLMDLSYCDRLHHVGCLAALPALETLILDSTDVTPAEVRQLRQSRSLGTLSVRFCTEFAFIGKDQKELEEVVGTFPSLKHYVYEDLIGDDALRKKKTV